MINNQCIKKLQKSPRAFALKMDDHDIEKVIVEFVEVKLLRDKSRRKRARCP